MIRIAGSVSKGWMARQIGPVFDRDYYFDPSRRHKVDRMCAEAAKRLLGDLNVFYTESNLGRREYFDENLIQIGGLQPNMLVGCLLGAELIPHSDADADISTTCLAGGDVTQLPTPESLVQHPLVCQLDEQIREVLDDDTSPFQPIPPFFWDQSGRAAVHGAVTSGMKFHGDAFLADMVVEPDRCRRVVDWLTRVSIVLVEHFSTVGRMPVEGIHVGECVSCMVDVANFRTFMVPAASALGRHFPPLRFHSCGRSDHIIESCKMIDGIGSIDVGGETSVAEIRRVFGLEFPVGIAPLVGHMSAL